MSRIDEYTDSTILTFGKYKNRKLGDVPHGWIAWYYRENLSWYLTFKHRRNRLDTINHIPHKTKFLLCEYIEDRLINPEL